MHSSKFYTNSKTIQRCIKILAINSSADNDKLIEIQITALDIINMYACNKSTHVTLFRKTIYIGHIGKLNVKFQRIFKIAIFLHTVIKKTIEPFN